MKPSTQTIEIVAYYATCLKSFDMEIHTHRNYEYMYVVQGECEITVETQAFSLHENQFVFLSPGLPHRLYVAEGSPCTLLNLEFRDGGEGTFRLEELSVQDGEFAQFWAEKPAWLVLEDTQKVCFALKDLIAELLGETHRGAGRNGFLLDLLMARLLIETARCWARTPVGKPGVRYVNLARAYIDGNFDEELSVSAVAEQVGINPAYLQSLFSRCLGCGVMSYVNHLRLDKACFLLKNSGKSITDIAFEVGFNSRQEFGYSFDKRFGQSPRQYRKLLASNLEVDTQTFRIR